jgi:hypothetical protein
MAGDGTDTDAAFEDEVEQTLTIREYMDGIEAEELVITRPTLPISAHFFLILPRSGADAQSRPCV